MKIHFDKKLLKYSIYVTLTAIAIFLALTIMSNIGTIFTTIFSIIGNCLSLIKPLLIAIIIAYLLFPLTRSIENFLRTNTIYKVKKQGNRRMIAIISSYLLIIAIVLAIIWGIYFMIGGQLSKSTTLTNIINDISSYLNSNSFTTSSIKSTLENLNISFIDKLEPYIIQIVDTVQKYIINNLGLMTSNIMSIGSSIATFFISIIISIYILKDSEYFIGLWKKLYSLIFKDTVAAAYASVAMIVVVLFSYDFIMKKIDSNSISCLLSIFMGIIIYIIAILLFKVFNVDEIKNRLVRK